MAACGGPTEAKDIFSNLVQPDDFELPEIDYNSPAFQFPASAGNPLYGDVDKISLEELTDKTINGAGVFDALMQATSVHLQSQYADGRITGREYADVYTAAIQASMAQAVQFLVTKGQAYWSGILVQAQARQAEIEAVTARINLENTKLQNARLRMEASTAAADYALKLLQLPLLDQDLCLKKAQLEGLNLDTQTKQFTLDSLLPAQEKLLAEQTESARAQTQDTRLDGTTPITGVLGKQKDLYAQQITSYQRDGEIKAAKMFIDSWVTQKTIDEALTAPDALNNASVNTVMSRVKTNNGLDV